VDSPREVFNRYLLHLIYKRVQPVEIFRQLKPRTAADATDQNVTLRPNWIWRAPAAELITPNVDDPKVVPGFPKFVWLTTLKTSLRNSVWIFSVILKSRISDISTWISPGPRIIPTPALPNV